LRIKQRQDRHSHIENLVYTSKISKKIKSHSCRSLGSCLKLIKSEFNLKQNLLSYDRWSIIVRVFQRLRLWRTLLYLLPKLILRIALKIFILVIFITILHISLIFIQYFIKYVDITVKRIFKAYLRNHVIDLNFIVIVIFRIWACGLQVINQVKWSYYIVPIFERIVEIFACVISE
jgi:hypothetical protein